MTRAHAPSRRGLTLVELLLASAVTAMVAMAIASMMTSVSSVAQGGRENRSSLLRAHAVRESLRAYVEPSLAPVQLSADASSVALWLEDDVSPGFANLLELRLIRFDSAGQRILAERVAFPEVWHAVLKQNSNSVITSAMNPIAMIEAFRSMGMTREVVLASGIDAVRWSVSDEANLRNSARLRVEFDLIAADPGDATTTTMLAAFGLADHRSPSR